jgi:hypothetical protein
MEAAGEREKTNSVAYSETEIINGYHKERLCSLQPSCSLLEFYF